MHLAAWNKHTQHIHPTRHIHIWYAQWFDEDERVLLCVCVLT